MTGIRPLDGTTIGSPTQYPSLSNGIRPLDGTTVGSPTSTPTLSTGIRPLDGTTSMGLQLQLQH